MFSFFLSTNPQGVFKMSYEIDFEGTPVKITPRVPGSTCRYFKTHIFEVHWPGANLHFEEFFFQTLFDHFVNYDQKEHPTTTPKKYGVRAWFLNERDDDEGFSEEIHVLLPFNEKISVEPLLEITESMIESNCAIDLRKPFRLQLDVATRKTSTQP